MTTVYVPGTSAGKRYVPLPSVVVTAGAVPGDAAVTVAPTKARPCASVTRPSRVTVCAWATPPPSQLASTAAITNDLYIEPWRSRWSVGVSRAQ